MQKLLIWRRRVMPYIPILYEGVLADGRVAAVLEEREPLIWGKAKWALADCAHDFYTAADAAAWAEARVADLLGDPVAAELNGR